jgi:hypothetical protein
LNVGKWLVQLDRGKGKEILNLKIRQKGRFQTARIWQTMCFLKIYAETFPEQEAPVRPNQWQTICLLT